MEQYITSNGKCLFCGQAYAKANIVRHLKTHLKQKETENKKGKSYLVKIEAIRYSSSDYFLLLWIDGEATMKQIDAFLRDIWLECCGHMSAFTDPKVRKQKSKENAAFMMTQIINNMKEGKYVDITEYVDNTEESDGEVPMNRKVKTVFHKDLKLEYEYDFGSTTMLSLNVMGEYEVKADKKIVLLSRNEPLELLCDLCKKEPATQICTVHGWNEDSLFCDKCAKKHAKECPDFDDYASLPVVNSPRRGVCCYEGGSIDVERDGIFIKQ
jgi:hypothetical protein